MANKDFEILPAESVHYPSCDFDDFVSLYLESCEPFPVIYSEPELDPCTNLDEPNILKTVALISPYESFVVTESSDFRDNDGKFGGNEIDEIKRSSNQSTCRSSLYKRKDTKLAARKSKRYCAKRSMSDLLAADVGRGQRSNLVRCARPSAWGLVGTVDEIFKQNAEMYVDAKGRAGCRKGKNITDSVSQSIQASQVDSRASSKGSLVVKLKLGTKAIQNFHFNTIPDLEKDLDSYRDVKLEASMLQRDIKDNYEKEVARAFNENLHKNMASSKVSGSSNVLQTERERSEIPKMKGIGESVENRCLDPETSPNTEVFNVIPDIQIIGNTKEGIRVPPKDNITHQSGVCYVGSGITSPEIVNDVLSCEKNIKGSWSSGASVPIANGIVSSNASYREAIASLQESVIKSERSIAGIESVDLRFSCQHSHKSSKSKSSVNKNRTNCWQKGSPDKSTAKGNAKEKSRNPAYRDTETLPVTGSHEVNDARGLEDGTRRTAEPIFTVMPSEGESWQGPPPSVWVCCDDCHKWRRISAILADLIESPECRWTCKENMDKAFADCSIPQEKSNTDINEELELSEASCEEDACNTRLNSNKLVQKQPTDPQQPSWKLIKTNMFLHRNRKNQPIDEVMVCHCKPPVGGHMGCGDECLNRMLNIECVKGTCPCGDFCSNQQFQKHKYSKMKYFPSGKKGYGLQLLEDIPKGRFLIEYVGEVLDMPAYEARQRDYASKGHKHFYFMTLNGSEVIDACAKGNLGRFINHSCEPNCLTEKWMVNGEVCIGLFAIRDIKKGEELTFDYNYVRVFGAAAIKCVCGSSRCRGVIGGDPQNDEQVVWGDSDAEYPEPAMFYENSNYKLDDIVPVTHTAESTFINNVESDQRPDSLFVTDEKIDDSAILTESTEREVSEERSSSATSESESKNEHTEGLFPSFILPLDTFEVCDVKSEITKQNENIASVHLVHEDGNPKKKTKVHTNEKKCTLIMEKTCTKLHSTSSALTKEKFKSKQPEIHSKPLVVPEKPKKLVADNLTGRFEAVEEALNSLLTEGGISKRKDAWKGYLTLLCLTANGGNGEGIQSNRDLSMILDVLLRTKSRTVLHDIINKNGLQMLHILLKRYREVFNKTPILRKLLKVLEFLAEKKILALENILKPSLPGVESFKESILSLTEHEDKEVHQIARNFRDRYIPWYARRVNRAERDTDKSEFLQNSNLKSFVLQQRRPSEAADNHIKQLISGAEGPPASCLSTDGARTRKRKSRWDQPGDVESPSKREIWSNINVGGSQHHQINDGKMDGGGGDAPGFLSSVNHPLFPSNPSTYTQTVKGQAQGRYISRLPIAFGVPCSLLKNVGTPKGAGAESRIVAPGMSFLPFPPLPVYPCGNNLLHVKEQSWRICNFQRDRNHNALGKRYVKQQKWNYSTSGNHERNPNKYGPSGFGGSIRNRSQR